MTKQDLKSEIEKKVNELVRIHKNTLWYGISEKKAIALGERMNILEKEIENLRSLI